MGWSQLSYLDVPRAEKKRIAMVAACPFPTPQGTQVFIRHLAEALARAGHDVHLITYGIGESVCEASFTLHRTLPIPTGTRSGPNMLKPAADVALLWKALQVVRRHDCEILHVHHVEGAGIGAVLKHQTGLPLVYHAHTALGPELPTYFRGSVAQGVASVVGDWADSVVPRMADAVITFNPDHKALHVLYGVDEARVHVIPPGLNAHEIQGPDRNRLAALEHQLGAGPWILYAGNPDGYQNLGLLWRSFSRLRQKWRQPRLLVASHHPQKAFEHTDGWAALSRDVKDAMTFHRYEHVEELRCLFALAHVGVCTRTLWAGAPIKVLNYLAAGLPVVACRDAARHLMGPDDGFAVDADPEALAEALQRVLQQDQEPRDMESRFHLETQIPLYERVYARFSA